MVLTTVRSWSPSTEVDLPFEVKLVRRGPRWSLGDVTRDRHRYDEEEVRRDEDKDEGIDPGRLRPSSSVLLGHPRCSEVQGEVETKDINVEIIFRK